MFLVDGNKQQITAIGDHARARGLKVPVLIDFIDVSGYLGKAAAALHPGEPQAAREGADGQKLRVLHGRAKAAAATLASVAARTRAKASTRHLDLADVDKCSATRWLGTSASRCVGMTGDWDKGPAGGAGGAGGARVVAAVTGLSRSAVRAGDGSGDQGDVGVVEAAQDAGEVDGDVVVAEAGCDSQDPGF